MVDSTDRRRDRRREEEAQRSRDSDNSNNYSSSRDIVDAPRTRELALDNSVAAQEAAALYGNQASAFASATAPTDWWSTFTQQQAALAPTAPVNVNKPFAQLTPGAPSREEMGRKHNLPLYDMGGNRIMGIAQTQMDRDTQPWQALWDSVQRRIRPSLTPPQVQGLRNPTPAAGTVSSGTAGFDSAGNALAPNTQNSGLTLNDLLGGNVTPNDAQINPWIRQAEQVLPYYEQVIRAGPQSLGAGAMENMSPTELALFASALKRLGIPPEDWIEGYKNTRSMNNINPMLV